MGNPRIEQLGKWIFYFMGGFALSCSLSMAATSLFFSLGLVAGLWRLWLKYDDVWPTIKSWRGVSLVLLLYWITIGREDKSRL